MSSENPHHSSNSPGYSPPPSPQLRTQPLSPSPPPSPTSPFSCPSTIPEDEENPQSYRQDYAKLLEEIDEEFKHSLTLSPCGYPIPPPSPPQEQQSPEEQQEQDPFVQLQIAALELSMAAEELKALQGKAPPGFENPQMNLLYLLRCRLPPGFDCKSTAPSDPPHLLNFPLPPGFNCEFTGPPDSGYFGSDYESIAAENAALDAFYASRATQQHPHTSNSNRPFQIREPELPVAAMSIKESLDESLPLKGPTLFEESETDEKEDDDMTMLFQSSETEEQDDITTLKYLSSYRSDGGPYSYLHDFEDNASTSSVAPGRERFPNPVIAYINSRLPQGESCVGEMQLRLKLSRLWTEFLKMLEKYGQNSNLDQHLSRPENEDEMFCLLKSVWTQKGPVDDVQEGAVNVVDSEANANELSEMFMWWKQMGL